MSVPTSVRTSLQLYRDCMRLVSHVAPGHSAKAEALRSTVRSSFAKNRDLIDPGAIAKAKEDAIRALANYMLMESGIKDGDKGVLGKAMKSFVSREQESIRKPD